MTHSVRARENITDGENILVKAGDLFKIVNCISTDLDMFLGTTDDGSTLFAVSQREFYFQQAAATALI